MTEPSVHDERPNTRAMAEAVNRKRAEALSKYGPLDGLIASGHGLTCANLLRAAGSSDEDIYLWLVSPSGWLDGHVPADLLPVDGVRVVGAAYIATLPTP